MAPRRPEEPTHLILDFDGTLTVKDTMAILGRLPKSPPTSWEKISDAYMEDYEVYKQTPYPWKNYDDQEYSGWLAARKWVEEKSAQRVQDSGFFRGVTLDDVNEAVASALDDGSLQLRDGWLDLFELLIPNDMVDDPASRPSKISIVSVNWSETFIRRALWQAAQRSDHEYKEAIRKYINGMEIHANEIQGLDRPEGSSGVICRASGLDIRTSDDKLRRMPEITRIPIDSTPLLIVYLGDSSTDFDCLMRAHIGVWIQDVKVGQYQQAFNQTFKPLKNFGPKPLWNEEMNPDFICWSPDLGHVLRTLMKLP